MKNDNKKFTIKGEHYLFNVSKEIKKGSKLFKDVKIAIRKFVQNGDRVLLDIMEKQGYCSFVEMKENLIATVGRAVFSERLAGGVTYTGEITYGAVGDDTTPFSNASTQLGNEIYRTQPDSQSFDGDIAYIDFFIASGDTGDDTFEEWGTFIDGGAGADSGQAFSLLITGGWVKSGSIYISSKYTVS